MTLLTPKSVNDTLNTKVQHCWVTPSQPRDLWSWWRWDEQEVRQKPEGKGRKQKWNGGNFPLSQSTNKEGMWTYNFFPPNSHVGWFLPSNTSCFLPLSLSSSLFLPSRLGWLGVYQTRWTLVFNMYCSLTLVSVMSFLDWIVCARLGILFQGPRTISFGYLCSTNRAQIFHVSGSIGFVQISISNDRESLCSTCVTLGWVGFFFHLLPNSHLFHVQVFIACNLANDMVLKILINCPIHPRCVDIHGSFFLITNVQLLIDTNLLCYLQKPLVTLLYVLWIIFSITAPRVCTFPFSCPLALCHQQNQKVPTLICGQYKVSWNFGRTALHCKPNPNLGALWYLHLRW